MEKEKCPAYRYYVFTESNTSSTYYHPQRSCSKVIFSQASVSHFTRGEGRGVSDRHPPVHAGIHPPPIPVHVGIHPHAQCMLVYSPLPPVATAADGTHPTGMHPCKEKKLLVPLRFFSPENLFITTGRHIFVLTVSCRLYS